MIWWHKNILHTINMLPIINYWNILIGLPKKRLQLPKKRWNNGKITRARNIDYNYYDGKMKQKKIWLDHSSCHPLWGRKKSYRYALFCMSKIFICKFGHFSLHTKKFHPKIFNQSWVISVQKLCTSGAIYFLSTEQKWFLSTFPLIKMV